jgi:anti-sigma factor RsiW
MSDRPYITCRELITFLNAYLASELAADRVVEFERHLSVCPSCVAYVRTYREAVELGRRAFDVPLDAPAGLAGVPEELVAAIVAASGSA